MRILITVHQFLPQYRAGTEILTLSVVNELIKRGYDVRIFTGYPEYNNINENKRFDEYQYKGIHIYRFHHSYIPMFDQMSMIEIGYNNHVAKYYFTEVCKSFQPQLVHHFHLNRLGIGIINYLADIKVAQYFTPTDFWMICPTAKLMLDKGYFCHGPSRSSGNCIKHFAQHFSNQFVASLIKRIPNTIFDKVSNITQKYNINYPMSYEVKAIANRINNTINALNQLQGIISPNNFMSELLIKYGVSKSIIHERSFGININIKLNNIKYKKWIKDQPIKIIFIGTLAPHKGCDIAIKAFNLLPKNFATLTIFGNEKEFPKYVKKLHNLAADKKNIFFKGVLKNYKIIFILSKFDVLVFPSIWVENTPLVIYSAQAAKCPVIGSNLPGISSLISHNVNGLLFEAGNYKDLYKKIKYLRENLNALSRNCIMPKTLQQYVDDICNIWKI